MCLLGGIGLACCGAACLLWGCQRCCLSSGHKASSGPEWQEASEKELQDVPRICRIILAVYERDLNMPVYADRLSVDHVIKRVDYEQTAGRCPPYLIYVDHQAGDICFAMRGLNMGSPGDYKVLMDQRKGEQFFDGGYVHSGFLHSARWALEQELDLLDSLARTYPTYSVTLAGHSLGSGVVAMMAVLIQRMEESSHPVSCKERTALTSDRVRCFAIAPARCVSLNLAVRYADVISSVILQDDFMPRTSAPMESILSASFCLPCFLGFKCCSDLFVSEGARFKDRRRLYAPGRLYHITYTKDFSCKHTAPIVKTAVPVYRRFEGVVFSRTMIDDHSIVHMEEKATAALQELRERAAEREAKEPPKSHKMARSELRLQPKNAAAEPLSTVAENQVLGVSGVYGLNSSERRKNLEHPAPLGSSEGSVAGDIDATSVTSLHPDALGSSKGSVAGDADMALGTSVAGDADASLVTMLHPDSDQEDLQEKDTCTVSCAPMESDDRGNHGEAIAEGRCSKEAVPRVLHDCREHAHPHEHAGDLESRWDALVASLTREECEACRHQPTELEQRLTGITSVPCVDAKDMCTGSFK